MYGSVYVNIEHSFLDKDATKDFVRWETEKSETGPNPGTYCPKRGTRGGRFRLIRSLCGPHLGPWSRFCRGPRSQTTARI